MTTTAISAVPRTSIDEHVSGVLRRKELLTRWSLWRAAVCAHAAAVSRLDPARREREERFPANIRCIGPPTFRDLAATEFAWMSAATECRTALAGTPESHGYVAKTGRAHEALCPEHRRFRRVAWTKQRTPLLSVREHNVEYHGGVPARVYDVPGREPSSLLP